MDIAPPPSEYRKVKIFKKLIPEDKLILIISLILSFILLILAIFMEIYKDLQLFGSALLLSSIIVIAPYTIYLYFTKKLDERILDYYPAFLRDLANSTLSGLSLIQALKIASSSNYGPLTPMLKRLYAWLTWGIPFEKAIKMFNDYFDTLPIIKKINNIIIEAYRSGGEIAKVLKGVSSNLEILRDLEKEKRAFLNEQIAILYLIFALFSAILVILLRVLAPMVSIVPVRSSFNISFGNIDLEMLKTTTAITLFVEAVSVSAVIGFAISNDKVDFLKHLFLLSLIAGLISIYFILPPTVSFSIFATPSTVFPNEDMRIYGSIRIDGKPPTNILKVNIIIPNFTNIVTYTDNSGYFEVKIKAPQRVGTYEVIATTTYKGKEYKSKTKFKVI